MQEGLKKAVSVPMKLAMTASALFAPLQELAQLGNINCKSDLQVISFNPFLVSIFIIIESRLLRALDSIGMGNWVVAEKFLNGIYYLS